MVMKRNSLLRDTEQKFPEPLDIAESPDLSDAEKIRLLENWQTDLLELLRATEENMPGVANESSDVAEKLRRVHEALAAVRRAHPYPEKPV
jgi:hypothetical protein